VTNRGWSARLAWGIPPRREPAIGGARSYSPSGWAPHFIYITIIVGGVTLGAQAADVPAQDDVGEAIEGQDDVLLEGGHEDVAGRSGARWRFLPRR